MRQKTDADDDVDKLKDELVKTKKLVTSLRQEVEQKENIAALAVTGNKVSGWFMSRIKSGEN